MSSTNATMNESSSDHVMETCKKMHKTIKKLEKTLASCIPIDDSNATSNTPTKSARPTKKAIKLEEKRLLAIEKAKQVARKPPVKLDLTPLIEAAKNDEIKKQKRRGRPPKKITI